MTCEPIGALSPLDGRYAGKVMATRALGCEQALHRYRLTVEIHWLCTLAGLGAPFPSLNAIQRGLLMQIIADFDAAHAREIQTIEQTTNHDVKAVEYYLKQQMQAHPQLTPLLEIVHFALTSEDVNNLAYALMVQEMRATIVQPSWQGIVATLSDFATANADVAMLARTHGQPASPTTLGKEIANVVWRIQRQLNTLATVAVLGKCNGATGNFNAHVVACPQFDWSNISKTFVAGLGLKYNPMTTQIEPHDYLAELFHCMQRLNAIGIDCCRDIWGYISLNYIQQATTTGEVGSSTMPHKVNPIDFENAEGNFGIANALLSHMAAKLPISRWQRDLSDSTVLRNIGSAIGYVELALASFATGLSKISANTACISADLAKHANVLAEPIQTVMRLHGCENPYEQLKAMTRGNAISTAELHSFIATLAIPDSAKQRLLQLTPAGYIGLAAALTQAHLA